MEGGGGHETKGTVGACGGIARYLCFNDPKHTHNHNSVFGPKQKAALSQAAFCYTACFSEEIIW